LPYRSFDRNHEIPADFARRDACSVRRSMTAVRALVLSSLLATVGCSAVSERTYDSIVTSTGDDAGVTGGYPDGLWNSETGGFEVGPAVDGASTNPSCVPQPDGTPVVCLSVNLAASGPALDDAAKALGIDGVGVLVVGLSTAPFTHGVVFTNSAKEPPASSGARFMISELPKTLTLPVPAGHYYLYATFRDAEPYDRDNLAVGDFTTPMLETSTVDVHPGDAVSLSVPLFPVRALDAQLSLDAKPALYGVGPARAWLRSADGVVGEGRLGCVDFSSATTGTTVPIRVLTTSSSTAFDLFGAFYDGALGIDDPALDTGFAPPAGAITSFASAIGGLDVTLPSSSWVSTSSPPPTLSLSHVTAGTLPTKAPTTCISGAPAAVK
jgi:hypothetical protein